MLNLSKRSQSSFRLAEARLYPILDLGYTRPADAVSVLGALVANGADLVELRAKDFSVSEQVDLVRKLAPVAQEARVPLLVNDHLEVALAAPGTGLHVGQDDIDPREARQALGDGPLLGLSTHSAEQAAAADSLIDVLDYFCVGPIFSTATKPEYPAVGLELLRLVSRMSPRLPFFAIGGVNRQTLSSVLAAGATRVCVVSDILLDPSPGSACRVIRCAIPH